MLGDLPIIQAVIVEIKIPDVAPDFTGQIWIDTVLKKNWLSNGTSLIADWILQASLMIPYANVGAFPATGSVDSIYLAQDTCTLYCWNGSAYVKAKGDESNLDTHIANLNNPHSVAKADVGLSNVDNTSDVNKPVSTAQQTALDGKVDDSQVLTNVPLGAVFTDSDTVYDDTAIQAEVDLNTTHRGLVVGNPHAVTKTEVGLSNVDNTSDINKPVSTAQQTALDGKVDDSQVLTNVPLGAVFTDSDTVYDDTAIQAEVDLNTTHRGLVVGNPHATSLVNIGSGTLAQLNAKISDATLADSGDILFQKSASNITLKTSADLLGLGVTPTAKLHVKGAGATSATYALKIENSSSARMFQLGNDNKHSIGPLTPISTATLKIGGSGNSSPATSGSTQGTGHLLRFQAGGATSLDWGINASSGSFWAQGVSATDLSSVRCIQLQPVGGAVCIGDENTGTTKNTYRLRIKGSDTSASNYTIYVRNSANTGLFFIRNNGRINMGALPTSSAGLAAGDLWNNSNVINIV